MPRRTVILVFICFMFLTVGLSFASEDMAAAEQEWYPPSVGPVTTWTAPLCAQGDFVVQPFFFYSWLRSSFDSEGHSDSLPDGDRSYSYQQQLFLQYGITDRLEIDGQFIYQENYTKQAETEEATEAKAHSSGLGDSYLFLRYCALHDNGWVPETTGLLQLKIPTGKYQHLNSDKLGTDSMGSTSGGGSWDPGFGINLSKRIKPFILHADAAYSFPQKVMVDGVKTIYGKYFTYDAGVEYFLPLGFNLMLEANGFLQGDIEQDNERVPSSNINYLIVSPGIGWSCDKLQVLLAYQRTVTGTNTDAWDSVVLTCVYTF